MHHAVHNHIGDKDTSLDIFRSCLCLHDLQKILIIRVRHHCSGRSQGDRLGIKIVHRGGHGLAYVEFLHASLHLLHPLAYYYMLAGRSDPVDLRSHFRS